MQRNPRKNKAPPARLCACGCGKRLNGSNRTVRKRYLNTAHRVRRYRQRLQAAPPPVVVVH